MDEIRSTEIGQGITLHTLNTEKFKTITVSLYIHNLINKNAALNALLPRVLKSGSRNFTSPSIINEYIEDMYGAVFETDIIKKGDIQSILLYMQFISSRYTENESVLERAIGILSDVLLNPIVEDGGFKKDYVNIEKNILKEQIASRINDKIQYAVERCMEIVGEGEPFSIYKYGNIEDVENINEKSLYNHYKCILENNPIDIFVFGDMGSVDIEGLIREKLTIQRQNYKPLGFNSRSIINRNGSPRVVKECMDVNQGKLCVGYRTGIQFTDKMYPALSVFTSILGGGMHSKLFQNLREKESLAYYVYSGMEKFKAILIVNCGIEIDKYEKALEIIDKQVLDIKNGIISDYEIESSIKKIKSDFKAVGDSIPLMIDYSLGGILYGKKLMPTEMMKRLDHITKEQIIEAALNVQLDAVYFLKSRDEE